MPNIELPQAEFKVVILGDSNAGKTSLLLRFAEGYYRAESRSATVGAFFLAKRLTVHHNVTCKMLIWDTAGNEKFRKLAITYYKNAAAAILAFDVTKESALNNLYYWLQELQCNTTSRRIVIVIVACKCDLEPARGMMDEAQKVAASIDAIYVETSAKENFGVNDVFKLVSERVLDWHNEYVNSGYSTQLSIPVKVGGVVASVQRSRSHGGNQRNSSGNGITSLDDHTLQNARTSPDSISKRNIHNLHDRNTTVTLSKHGKGSADGRLEIKSSVRQGIHEEKQPPTLADTDSSEGSKDQEPPRRNYKNTNPFMNSDLNHQDSYRSPTGNKIPSNSILVCDGGLMSCGVPYERGCLVM